MCCINCELLLSNFVTYSISHFPISGCMEEPEGVTTTVEPKEGEVETEVIGGEEEREERRDKREEERE